MVAIRVIATARADLCAGQHPVGLGPPHRVGHHRQRPAGLPGRLLVGPGGEQGPGQAGHEPVPGFVASDRRVQLAPEYLGPGLRGPDGQRGPGLDEPRPGPGLARLVRGGQLLRDAQHVRARGGEFPGRLGVQRRAQRGRHALVERLLDQQVTERKIRIVRVLGHDARCHCLLDVSRQFRCWPAQHHGQVGDREPAAEQRGRPEQLRRASRHGAEPVGQHGGQRGWQSFSGGRNLGGGPDLQGLLAHHGVDQLAYVQRVAGRLRRQLPQRVPRW